MASRAPRYQLTLVSLLVLSLQHSSASSAAHASSSSGSSRDLLDAGWSLVPARGLLADAATFSTHSNTTNSTSVGMIISNSSVHKLDSHGHDPAGYLTWHWRDWHSSVALVLAAVNFFAAASTGQGGTAVLIPIFTAMLHLPVNQAVACATFVIFLGSIPSLYHAMVMDHPYNAGTTLIDYSTMAILTPAMLVGIKAGVTLNKMSPDWFVAFLLVVAYSASTAKQLHGMLKLRMQEVHMARLKKRVEHQVAELEAPGDKPDAAAADSTAAAVSSSAALHRAGSLGLGLELPAAAPLSVQELQRRQTLCDLQDDIEEMVLLSREMMKTEALTLPPHALQCTTDTTIKSALEHPDTDSIAGASPRGVSPRGASPVYGGPNNLHILCPHGNLQPTQSPWAAAAVGGLQGGSPLGRSPRVSISELTDFELVQLGQALTRPSSTMSRHPSLLLSCGVPTSVNEQQPEAAGGSVEQQQGFAFGQRELQDCSQHWNGVGPGGANAPATDVTLQQQPFPCLGSPSSSPFCNGDSCDAAAPHTDMPAAAAAAGSRSGAALRVPAPAKANADAARAAAAHPPVQQQLVQPQRKLEWLRCAAVQAKCFGSMLLCRLQAWWAQQPLLLLLLITGNFALYIALCVIWSVMPPCKLGFFLGIGAFIAASAALAAAACWLHWPREAGMQPACCGHMLHLQQQQQQVPELLPAKMVSPGGCAVGLVSCDSAVRGSAVLQEMTMRPIDDSVHPLASAALSGIAEAAASAASAANAVKLGALPGSSSEANLAAAAAIAQQATAQRCKECPSLAVSEAGSAAMAEVLFNDIEWTRTRLLYFQPLMLLIGVASGLLGASPNTLFLTPMLIGFGQHPQVAAATLKLALFVSSGCSSVGFLVNGQLDVQHGLAFGITNLLVTPLGQLAMDLWIKRTGMASLILVANVVRNGLAIPLLIIFNGVPGVLDLMHGTGVHFETSHMCE